MKILVVDDNISITGMLSKFFIMKGHDCIIANTGKKGLSLCHNNKFDAIVLDLAMPRFTGRDFVDSLVQDGKIDKQKIIILTALPLGNVAIGKDHNGICEVLQKPCKLDFLMKTIESLNVVA